MASKVRAKSQVKKDRAALRKLVSTGLYKGKVDLRRKLTNYQRGLISKFADVIAGKSAVVQPSDPKSYSKLYQVVGENVIVPRRKTEQIRVDKNGEIVSTRKVRGVTIRSRLRKVRAGTRMTRPKEPVQYAIPFNRGDALEWMRHRSFDDLKAFMSEYARYKGWRKYAVSEKVAKDEGLDFEDDEDLTFILEERLGPQPGASGGRYSPKKKKRKAPAKKKVSKRRQTSRKKRRGKR